MAETTAIKHLTRHNNHPKSLKTTQLQKQGRTYVKPEPMLTAFDSFGHFMFWLIIIGGLIIGGIARFADHDNWLFHDNKVKQIKKENPEISDDDKNKLYRLECRRFKNMVLFNGIGLGLPLTVLSLCLVASYVQAKKIVHFQGAMDIAAAAVSLLIGFLALTIHDLLRRVNNLSGGG